MLGTELDKFFNRHQGHILREHSRLCVLLE